MKQALPPMLIAHLPSGYILSSYLIERVRTLPVSAVWVIAAGMLGAVAPDFDMLYFLFVDHGQTHHHRYMTHWPSLWLGLIALSLGWRWLARRSAVAWLLLVFSLGGMLHVLLDTLAGDIWWFAPLVDQRYALVKVTARYQPWWLNFIMHWVFLVELAICAWAFWRFRRRAAWNRQID
ncbi:inner membrane protein [Halopseudomonas sabulinigri]|uniref:Inner membrane protein n=2 Tax=Halopseudomonas sabulinigri TaxID=472181 RepID=A0A1H1TC80_9GAMM|nr:inner membrane protein [Halopseudomonas sabulinigri]